MHGRLLIAAATQAEIEAWNEVPSIQPPLPLYTWTLEPPQAAINATLLLGGLGSSQAGTYAALRGDLLRLAEGLPPDLLEEPGLGLLTSAVEAYMLFYPGVDSVCRAPFFQQLGEQVRGIAVDTLEQQAGGRAFIPAVNFFWQAPTGGNASIGNKATLYGGVFFDLEQAGGPLVVTIPPAPEQVYWLIPFGDLYQEIWASIGRRYGDSGGKWLILPPGYNSSLYGFEDPYILRSPNVEFMILGRVLQGDYGDFDPKKWQASWKFTLADGSPLKGANSSYTYTDATQALVATNVTEAKDPFYFWRAAGELYQRNPKWTLENPLLYQLPSLGLTQEQGFRQEDVSDAGLLALQWAIPVAVRLMEARYIAMIGAKDQGYWYVPLTNERWGYDYAQGAAIMKYAWILNWPEDAAYYFNFLSSDGVQLRANRTHRMDWQAPPPCNPLAFWAVQVIDLEDISYPNVEAITLSGENTWFGTFGNLEGNSLTSVGNSTSVRPDGSFSIIMGPTKPAKLEQGENWLDSSNFGDRLIYVYHRVYWPDKEVLNNEYVPPPVKPVAE